MSKLQITKNLKLNNIELKNIEIKSSEVEVFVENGNTGVADYDKTEELAEKVSAALGWGGRKTGYGAWVLSENYVADNFDPCDVSSPIHY